MRGTPIPTDGARLLRVLALPLLLLSQAAAAGPTATEPAVAAAPASGALDLSTVLELIRREIVAAEAAAQAGGPGANLPRIEGVQIELDLVDLGQGKFAVATPDYAAPQIDKGTLAFRRKVSLEWAPPRDIRVEGSPGGGALAKAINESRAQVRAAMGGAPAFDLKRLAFDLDFAVARNDKAQPVLILSGFDRKGSADALNRLKIRFTGKEGR